MNRCRTHVHVHVQLSHWPAGLAPDAEPEVVKLTEHHDCAEKKKTQATTDVITVYLTACYMVSPQSLITRWVIGAARMRRCRSAARNKHHRWRHSLQCTFVNKRNASTTMGGNFSRVLCDCCPTSYCLRVFSRMRGRHSEASVAGVFVLLLRQLLMRRRGKQITPDKASVAPAM